jgi:hypothetical protein
MKRSTIENRLSPRKNKLGSGYGYDVVRFLNAEAKEPDRASVLEVFGLCRELDALRRERQALREREALSVVSISEIDNVTSQVGSALNRLNKALRSFEFGPHVGGLDPYFVHWGVLRSAGTTDFLPRPAASFVQSILETLTNGALDRVRQCICGRWFLAKSNKKLVCSDVCRFRKFKEGNEAFNKHRAEYMHEYREAAKKRRKNRVKK